MILHLVNITLQVCHLFLCLLILLLIHHLIRVQPPHASRFPSRYTLLTILFAIYSSEYFSFYLPYNILLNLHLSKKPLFIPFGRKLYQKTLMLYTKLAHGILPNYPFVKILVLVGGYIR